MIKTYKIKGASDVDIKIILQNNYGSIDDRKTINNEMQYIWEGVKFKSEI